jgi:hypothetical protein
MQNKKQFQPSKIKVNIYLDFPIQSYYEMILNPAEVIGNLFKYIQNIFPKTKYVYNTDNPIFIDMDTENIIDTSKSFHEHKLNQESCSIKIKLKITPLL